MSHVSRRIGSCHTGEWVMSHVWMSCDTRMNTSRTIESRFTYEWMYHEWTNHKGTSHKWLRHDLNESCVKCKWMSHVSHTNECVTNESVRNKRVTNEWVTNELVMCHIQMNECVWCVWGLLITERPKTPCHYRYLIWVLSYIPYTGLAVFNFAITRVPVYTAISNF